VSARAREGRLGRLGGPSTAAAAAGWTAVVHPPAPGASPLRLQAAAPAADAGAGAGAGDAAAAAAAEPTPAPTPPPTTPEGDAARAALAAALADETRAAEEAKGLREEDGTDFGPDGAFFPLKGKCFDLRDAQYGYSVCPFGRASQDGTHLGTFSGWRAGGGAGAGAGAASHGAMLFKDGAACWGGPARSLALLFSCGTKDELVSVGEPEKCTYEAAFKTPAACDAAAAAELKLSLEDESGAEL